MGDDLGRGLGIEPQNLEQKAYLFTRWLRESLRDGAPMDQVVRSMLTAKGSAFRVPEANYWVTSRDPKVLAENAAQTFLGIRLQCAQCHNHPFERWRMDDYYGFAAFFTQVGRKNGDTPRESIVYDRSSGEIRNARTQQNAAPRFLGGDAPKIAGDVDRREVLADWLTSPRNPWFARNIANRVWARSSAEAWSTWSTTSASAILLPTWRSIDDSERSSRRLALMSGRSSERSAPPPPTKLPNTQTRCRPRPSQARPRGGYLPSSCSTRSVK